MNYYFLLEDEKSFMKILPKWFEYIGFKCTRVADIKDVEKNNYILQSGKGVTRLITNDTYVFVFCLEDYGETRITIKFLPAVIQQISADKVPINISTKDLSKQEAWIVEYLQNNQELHYGAIAELKAR